jgi:mono/diheme cytochrome c family protein
MHKLLWFFAGAALVTSVAGLGGLVFLKTGAGGFSARETPSTLETFAARRARAMATPAEARSRANPIAETSEVLAEARAHWADHCAACHANNGSGDVEMGKHMYPPAPDMRRPATQDLSDGELFYIIQNGIRLTGMPSWGSGTPRDEQDSWKLVRFIRHLPSLTPEEENDMKELNPKSPDELKEEQEEKEFLNGGQSDESTKNGETHANNHAHQH